MDCPHCHSPLSSLTVETSDGQSQLLNECLNCGGHFLPPYLTSFISADTAKNIDSVLPKATTVPTSPPTCPLCNQVMPGIKDDSVPGNVTVFTCPNNHGDFFPKGQLLQFKNAQQAKIHYHKLWGIPLKSAFAVILPVAIVFTAITALPAIIKQAGTSQELRTKASDILTPPLITPISGTQVLISFSTQNPVKSAIRFTEGSNQTYIVSSVPQTNHLLNLEDLKPGTLYQYVIILEENNKKTTTDTYTFATP